MVSESLNQYIKLSEIKIFFIYVLIILITNFNNDFNDNFNDNFNKTKKKYKNKKKTKNTKKNKLQVCIKKTDMNFKTLY